MRKTMRLLFTAVGLSAACGLSIATFTTAADASAASKLKTYDTDHDGTLDLKEVTAGATTAFNALEKDHDGTLDIKELHGRLSKAEFGAADPDHDKTLSKEEYIAAITKAFKAADTDHDGTLDLKELKSKSGQEVVRMLK